MSLEVATWVTPVATVLLAVGAAITATFAYRALQKQSAEVKAIEQQVSDQKELTARQADLLKVQTGQLELQQRQFKQQEDDRRRDQASRLVMRTETYTASPLRQAQRAAGERKAIAVYVTNTSEQPVYDLTVNWRKGTARWDEPERLPILTAGEAQRFSRNLPDNLPQNVDRSLYSAVVIFRDRNQVWWRTRPDGRFEELPPGSEPPHSW